MSRSHHIASRALVTAAVLSLALLGCYELNRTPPGGDTGSADRGQKDLYHNPDVGSRDVGDSGDLGDGPKTDAPTKLELGSDVIISDLPPDLPTPDLPPPDLGLKPQVCSKSVCVLDCNKTGNCSQDCQGATNCQAHCLKGGCAVDCKAATICASYCSDGKCNVKCSPKSNCIVDCVGGGCVVECNTAFPCSVNCYSGNCTVKGCGAGCSVFCPKNNCTITP